MARDTVGKTIIVATSLCLVCATVVSAFAVGLREKQEVNKLADLQKNILVAAGSFDESKTVEEQFAEVDAFVIDLETGAIAEEIDPDTFDQRAAANDPSRSTAIPSSKDLAGIRKRSSFAPLYVFKDDAGDVDCYVFPVNGKGLWSTLYGMLALEPDLTTVRGLIFYEHKETPGLGGEVDNPRWKALWPGKQIYGPDLASVRAEVIKGNVRDDDPNKQYRVDGLTGATITARGVSNLVRYWMGDDAFGPFITKLREGEALNG